jgi:hypothetical protein
MDQGWVKSHRKMLDNIFLMKDNNAYLVFTKLLLLVNKKTGQIAAGRNQLGEMMNIKPRTLYDVLLRLESQHMIEVDSNSRYSIITISKWNEYQEKPNSTKKISPTGTQQQPNSSPTTRQHSNKNKEIELEINTTNVVLADKPQYGNAEINEMFDYWEELTGNKITSQVTYNRRACSNLIKKHGVSTLKRMIGGVAYSHGERYAPTIANFVQLQAKWDELVVWGKRHATKKTRGFTVQ